MFTSHKHPYWNSIPSEQWASWAWQLQNKITTIDQLKSICDFDSTLELYLEDILLTQNDFQFGITPYYFSLINAKDRNCAIRAQCIPSRQENIRLANEYLDFPKEESMMPVPGLTHRYPDRVMLYTTHHCAVYCRFCTRKRKVSNPNTALQSQQINDAIDYIKGNSSIREVILSGGDILSFSDRQLDHLICSVHSIPHIEIIRLGTRNLVTLPFRITADLVRVLKKYPPLFIHTHFNHPNECTYEAKMACRQLRNAGCVVNNHTVLLKGVNDTFQTLNELNHRLMLMGVQPYYLYHCDLTFGSHHFRTKISDDRKLVRELHQKTSWLNQINIPHYMIDTPGGGK